MDLTPIAISKTFLRPPQEAELGKGEGHMVT